MKYKGPISIYINITPKRWCVIRSYRALKALEKLSGFLKLGYTPGIHDGIGTRTNFVLHIIFASAADREAYEQDGSYEYFLRRLRRYSKRGGFKLLTS
jgi:hypothetical protein